MRELTVVFVLFALAGCDVTIAGRGQHDSGDLRMEGDDADAALPVPDAGAVEEHDTTRAEPGRRGPEEAGEAHEGGDGAPGDACVACADVELPRVDAGADANGPSPADAGGDAAPDGECRSFPVFERACSVTADCALGFRTFDCCGSMLVTGVRADQLAAFEHAADACQEALPSCDCASRPLRADDGSFDMLTNSSLPQVVCLDGQCWSSFSGFSEKTPCGDDGDACEAEYEVCITRTPVGGSAVHDCVGIPRACRTSRSCECMGEALCDERFHQCTDGAFANNITCTCPDCQ